MKGKSNEYKGRGGISFLIYVAYHQKAIFRTSRFHNIDFGIPKKWFNWRDGYITIVIAVSNEEVYENLYSIFYLTMRMQFKKSRILGL